MATLSHELRTPLNIAIGYADLLRDGSLGALAAEQLAALQGIRRATDKELELIAAMLEVSQLEAGQLPVRVQDIQLSELLSELAEETQKLLREKPTVRAEWRIAPQLPLLCTDRAKLKIVLKNLLSNATKFTDRGNIDVDVHPQGSGVEFCVADTGIGIAPEVRSVLFEMFRQGENLMTRRYGGMGLGLYIVKRLLDLLGGTVTVESEIGKGSTFRVWLPRRQ